MLSNRLDDLYCLLRRVLYFLSGKRRFKVQVNTHPWAWFVPLGEPVETFVPLDSASDGALGVDLEVTPSFGLTEATASKFVGKFVAILRQSYPQARFTLSRWQGADAWATHTFVIEDADGEQEKALLTKLEHFHQVFLLGAQVVHNRRHPDRPCSL